MANFRRSTHSEFEEKIIQVNRVSKKTKGGNRISFSVLTVVGDRKGRVGVGLGKAPNVRDAIMKGFKKAKKHLISVPMRGTTIPHRILLKKGAAKVLLKPAPVGTGLRTGGAVRAVVEVAGIRDMVSKILGTRNRASNVYATFEALGKLRPTDRTKSFKEAKKIEVAQPRSDERRLGQRPEKKESVENLNLSARTKTALVKAGIKTTNELKSMSEETILKIKGMGKKGLEEVKRVIQ